MNCASSPIACLNSAFRISTDTISALVRNSNRRSRARGWPDGFSPPLGEAGGGPLPPRSPTSPPILHLGAPSPHFPFFSSHPPPPPLREGACLIFCSKSSPRKFPRACRRRRPTICAAWSPTSLSKQGLVYEGAKAFATPRRLALTVHGIPARQPDLKEERKGPRVGGPDAAVQGFLKATGLKSLDEATIQKDPKKGDFYIALIEKPGRPTPRGAVRNSADHHPHLPVAEVDALGRGARPGPARSPGCARCIPSSRPSPPKWKSRKWSASPSAVSRPARPRSGHRFMAPAAIQVKRFDDYVVEAQGGQGRARSRAPRQHHSAPTPSSSLSRRATKWSRTRSCLRKSQVWSNGRCR